MATLVYKQIVIQGTDPVLAAAAGGGDKVAPSDRGFLLILNGSGGSITATVVVPGNTKYGLANPDRTVVVPAGAYRLFGPFPADLADPSDGLVAITYTDVTTVSVAAITL